MCSQTQILWLSHVPRLLDRAIIHGMPRLARQRLMVTLVLITSLLFQQVAMAAYVCTMPQIQVDSAVMAKDCAGMQSEPAQHPDAVCEKHCAPDPTSADTSSIPPVPPLTLPPVIHALAPTMHTCDVVANAVVARAHPPPRVSFCRLLI